MFPAAAWKWYFNPDVKVVNLCMRASVRAVEDMLKDEDNEVTHSYYSNEYYYSFVKQRPGTGIWFTIFRKHVIM